MNRRFSVPILICLGAAILLVGISWKRLFPSKSYWSEDQAKELNDAQFKLHEKSHHHGKESASHQREFTAAKARYERIYNQLSSAQKSRERSGTIFVIAGILTMLVGAGLHFVERSNGA